MLFYVHVLIHNTLQRRNKVTNYTLTCLIFAQLVAGLCFVLLIYERFLIPQLQPSLQPVLVQQPNAIVIHEGVIAGDGKTIWVRENGKLRLYLLPKCPNSKQYIPGARLVFSMVMGGSPLRPQYGSRT